MSNRKFNLDNEVQPEIHFRLLSISASKFEMEFVKGLFCKTQCF